jgi:hypothetical protein
MREMKRADEMDRTLDPGEEVALMDDIQIEANKKMGDLLPCDPCLDANFEGITEAEEPDMMELESGFDEALFDADFTEI